MSKHDQLLEFYQGLLGSLDFTANEAGELLYNPPGLLDARGQPMQLAAIVDHKRWVLPTKAILDQSPWEDHIAFHPLSENFTNGDSATLSKLKTMINIKLNTTLGLILKRLTEFAADTGRHGTVSAKAAKFLKLVPNLKETSAKRMDDIVARTELDSAQRRLANVFLKRRAKLDGRLYVRGAIVNFPFREELNGAEPKVFGVVISKKDQESFRTLFDYVLPENDELETYSAGTDLHTAPSFQVLLQAYVKLATQLNDVLHTHRKLFTGTDELKIDLSWHETVTSDLLEKLAVVVPPLPGNTGEPVKSNQPMTQEAVAAPKRATRVFDEKVIPSAAKPTPKAPMAPRSLDEAVAPVRPPEPREARPVEHKPSFAERMAQQRSGGTGRFREPEPARGGSLFDRSLSGRSYAHTQEEALPPWAENPTGSRTIAGTSPEEARELERRRQAARPGFSTPARSWSDRFHGAGGGGGFSGGSRFRL